MQTVVLSCLFGAVSAMVLWVAVSTDARIDEIMRRGKFSPPEQRP